MPWVIWAGLGLIGWRATDRAGEAIGDKLTAALPYVAGGVALYLVVKKGL